MAIRRSGAGNTEWSESEDPEDSLLQKPAIQARHLHLHQIPSWQRENEYVLLGYRPTSGSLNGSLWSILQWHNETISIHSHILGTIIFAIAPWIFYQYYYVHFVYAQPLDLFLFAAYSIGTSICFACSTSCHVVWNHSPSWAVYGNQLDYLGIVLLMWTASLPTIYYGFICNSHLRWFYWIFISAIASTCITATMNRRFSAPSYRPYRAALYASLGLTAFVFIFHGIWIHGFSVQNQRMSLSWMAWMGSFNVVGAVIYAVRVPERWWPYRFDFVGQSHQIFHVMVVIAGLIHFAGLLEAFKLIRGKEDFCRV